MRTLRRSRWALSNPRAAERGQALIEFVVFSFFAVIIGMAACEGGKYCLAQASAETACTAACREIAEQYALHGTVNEDDVDAVIKAAAPNIIGSVSWSEKNGNSQTTSYVHHLADSAGEQADRESSVSLSSSTVTVEIESSYLSSIGRALTALGGTDSYKVTSTHTVQIDDTLVSGGTSGSSAW